MSADCWNQIIIIIIIIIKNEKIRVTLCENAGGALYIVNKTNGRYHYTGGAIWWMLRGKVRYGEFAV